MADVIRFSSSLLTSFSCPSSFDSYQPIFGPKPCQSLCKRLVSGSDCSTVITDLVSGLAFKSRKQSAHFKVHAALTETEQPKWWERNARAANMIDIHSSEEFSNAISQAGDRLVIVDFYGTWCASCRALFPKLCRTAEEHPEILFLKVNFDENKGMCKNLNVRVLPYFHFYHGNGQLVESFSCSLAKFQKMKDAIQLHKTSRPKDVLAGGSLN